MFELFLRVQPDERNEDPHNRLSKKFPGARIALWCNDHTDILEIESDGLDSFQEMQKELVYYSKEYQSKIIAKTLCQDKFQMVVRTCICGVGQGTSVGSRSEEHTSELQSLTNLVCRLLLEKKK